MMSFSEISFSDFASHISGSIFNEISGNTKEYILGVEEENYKEYLINKFSLEPLTIDYENRIIKEPTISQELINNRLHDKAYLTDVYLFSVEYPFTGSHDVFSIYPSTRLMTSAEINFGNSKVFLPFKIYKLDKIEFERTLNEFERRAFGNVENANKDVIRLNLDIVGYVNKHFSSIKNKYLNENSFFEAINLNINKTSVFTAPVIKKKIIPQPIISKNKEFSSEPSMSKEIYEDIIEVIYNSGKNMEKKPSLYINKDEEGLRDQFLYVLESRYDGTTATGETFNREGKADILLKYAKDGTNIFVAECKLWHGASEFQNGISQLFDRYLTWRDSKTALLMFVKNKDFSNVLITIKDEIKKHPYFVKECGVKGESCFSYIFKLPQDSNKTVYFEVMAFHYDK